jgi:aspartate dehydrogenase
MLKESEGMKKIGILGCGTIGSFLAQRIEKDFKNQAKIVGLCDIDVTKARLLASKLSGKIPLLPPEKLIDKSDLIIESTSSEVCPRLCKKTIENGKDIMVMSVGGLIGNMKLFSLAKRKKCKIILPSGAICGLDGVKSAGIGGIKKVTLTTRKPPQGLKGAPYVVQKKIDLDSITDERVIFEGTAEEAVRGFPKNVNVSAMLSIVGVGPKKTKVRIITAPEYTVNSHEIEVEGAFGKLVSRTENVPFPDNPKTSFLAALSAVATLKQLLDDTKIGT